MIAGREEFINSLSDVVSYFDFGIASPCDDARIHVSIQLNPEAGVAPWGSNYAVRTAEQRKVPYDPGLGVSPHQRRVGEEAEVIYRLLSDYGEGWWVPQARVEHIIPVKRQTLSYIFHFFTSHGATVLYLERLRPGQHHKSSNMREIRSLRGGRLRLYPLAALNGLLFGLAWGLGARTRSLGFLMRAGFFYGAATFSE